MDTIKLSRTGQIILVIIILLIIAIAIASIKFKKEENSDESRLSLLSKRWKKLIKEIEEEMESLHLTREMQIGLEKEISIYIRLAIGVVGIIFISVAGLFFNGGTDLATSLVNTTGLFSLFFFGSSLLIVSKFVDPNTAIKTFGGWIRKKVYKKYNFDPATISVLQESISLKQSEANEISEELGLLR